MTVKTCNSSNHYINKDGQKGDWHKWQIVKEFLMLKTLDMNIWIRQNLLFSLENYILFHFYGITCAKKWINHNRKASILIIINFLMRSCIYFMCMKKIGKVNYYRQLSMNIQIKIIKIMPVLLVYNN